MSTSRSERPRRSRWAAASVAFAVAGAFVVGSVGIAVALEPTFASAPGESSSRSLADALPAVQISSMASTAGSLVGGEQQVITGRGFDAVEQIRVGNMTVTDFVVADRTLSFAMPRSARYTPGPVAIDVVASTVPVDAPDDLAYTYEVRTGVDRQLEYAFRHWADYNLAEYGTFNPVGGDCANFVSQTLIARGWQMSPSWFNDGGSSWSSSWIYTPAFESWLLNNPQLGAVRLEFDQREQVKVGDIVVFDWNGNGFLDHIQIVSAIENVDGRIEIKMVGHNRDTDFRDLDETITIDHPNGTGYFWSIPAN